jgi:hypothetical protein
MHWMEIEERQQLAEELAARGVRLDEGREWWQVGLMLECSLQIEMRPQPESSWNRTGTNSLASCGARSPLETGARQAPSSGSFGNSTRSATPISKWGKEGEAWHWKQSKKLVRCHHTLRMAHSHHDNTCPP